jgi:hypothetical protein
MLRFVHAAVSGRQRVEAFAIGTRLTRMTKRAARAATPTPPSPQRASGCSTGAAAPASASACARFNDEWGVRGMARGAIVVVLSDGWDRGDPEVLGEQMQRLQRVAFQTVWVNPLKVTPGYAPLARGMAAALPYVDAFVEGHSPGGDAGTGPRSSRLAPERRHSQRTPVAGHWSHDARAVRRHRPLAAAGPASRWRAWSTSRAQRSPRSGCGDGRERAR